MDAGKVAGKVETLARRHHGVMENLAYDGHHGTFAACAHSDCVADKAFVAELRAEAARSSTTTPKLLCVIADCLRPRSPSLPWCERHATGAGRSA